MEKASEQNKNNNIFTKRYNLPSEWYTKTFEGIEEDSRVNSTMAAGLHFPHNLK